MADPKRQCLALDEDMPLDDPANAGRKVSIKIKVTNMAAFANVIGSLRPSKKNPNEPQKEIIVILQKNLPVCKESLTGKNVVLIDGTTLSTVLTKPFTGMILVAVANDRTRFSVAMIECDVDGLADRTYFKRAVVPHTLVKLIRGYKNMITADFEFKYENYTMTQKTEHGETTSELAYVEMDESEDVREFFSYSTFEYCVRLPANVFLDKLRVMEGYEGYIALQELKLHEKRTMVLALSVTSDDFKLYDCFKERCGSDNTINFCNMELQSKKPSTASKSMAAASAAATALEEKDGESIDQILEESSMPSVTDTLTKTTIMNMKQLLFEFRENARKAAKEKQSSDEERAKATLRTNAGEDYRLICYRVLQSRTLMDLFQNLSSEMQHGLMLLMANDDHSPMLMVLPVNEKTTIVHAMSCAANYDD